MRKEFLFISALITVLLSLMLFQNTMEALAVSMLVLFFWFMVLAMIFAIDADSLEQELEECEEKCNNMEVFVEKVVDRIEELLDEKLEEKQCDTETPKDKEEILKKLEEVKENLKQI